MAGWGAATTGFRGGPAGGAPPRGAPRGWGYGRPRTAPRAALPALSPGWHGTPGASYRTGPGVPSSAPGHGVGVPPPLPTGTYNPSRDIEVQEAERGLGQTEGEIGTARTRAAADYQTNLEGIERAGGQQTEDFNRAQRLLAQSYQRLAGQQQEGANRAGVLTGGALLQSAAKRAANEGQQSEAQKTAYQRQQQANELEKAKLIVDQAPPDAANPLGGRVFQDLLSKLTNAQGNTTFFREGQQRLEGQEAAEGGYTPPGGTGVGGGGSHGHMPPSHARAHNASRGGAPGASAPAHGAPHHPAAPTRRVGGGWGSHGISVPVKPRAPYRAPAPSKLARHYRRF